MMKRFRKIAAAMLASVMVTGLVACGKNSSKSADGKLNVVATIFPEYDWTREIVGQGEFGTDKSAADKVEITLLLDKGTDLHSFQPTAEDITKISTCDVFIYVGGESDKWVDDALKEATNKNMKVINLMEVLGDSVKEEELVEGMQGEEHEHEHEEDTHSDGEAEDILTDELIMTDELNEADVKEGEEVTEASAEDIDNHDGDAVGDEVEEDHHHDEEAEGHHHDEGEIEYDEHVWLSLRNAQTITSVIAEKLGEADPDNAAAYKANAEAYNKKLSELDGEYKTAVDNAATDTLLFGDRFPFRYMVEDYGINYYAAFIGCSAETEASFETIIFLSGKLDELKLPAICTIENSDQKIAKTVKENSKTGDQEILVMDSLQSVSKSDVDSGATYYGKMSSNLDALKQALGSK